MIREESELNRTTSGLKMSSKASAFSIAAIIGEQPLKRASDNVSPSVSDSDSESIRDTDSVHEDCKSPAESGTFSPSGPDSPVSVQCSNTTESLPLVKCKLETRELWEKFNELGTEMIITKTGRRMFPTVRISFSELEPTSRYAVLMDIVPLDKKRYRYAYHRSSWLVAGKADPPPPRRLYMHPDGIFSGEQLMKQTVSFEKLKLTNNAQDKNGQIVLNSMHKYQPRIHIVKLTNQTTVPVSSLDDVEHKTFIFSETVFIAVTAYQNQLITKLKIDSNPFAKGFRDSTRLSEFENVGMEGMLQTSGFPRTPLRAYGDPDMADPLRLSPQERQKVLAEGWRGLTTSLPVTSQHYPAFVTSGQNSLSALSSTDASVFSSLYGQMLASQSLYNHELFLRSQLLKGVLGSTTGIHPKPSMRYHPYLPTSTEKLRDQS
ncbi:T-box transcription factor tbx20 [Mactra antiquata]